MKNDLTFDVRMTVPLKALETLVGLADDLECLLISATPKTRKAVARAASKPSQSISERTEPALEPAKQLILDKLKEAQMPVSRRTLVKELKANGFAKNSVGPLCSEMKKEGRVANPRRGYWTAASRQAAE